MIRKDTRKNAAEKRPHFWQSAKFRYGSLSTLILCVLLAAVVALNMLFTTLEKKNGWRVDYSFNALTTQSDTTVELLAELDKSVHIYALFSKGNEDLPLMELLDRYAAASSYVTWEQTDVSTNPALTTRFNGTSSGEVLTNDSLIVNCEATGRYKILSPDSFISLSLNYDEGSYEVAGLTYESQITNAIAYVTRDEIPRVMILQGQGELDADGTTVLADLLTSNNFEVCYFTLDSAEATLTTDDLLMILSPRRDLMDTELKTITEFAENGGSIFFTCDYSDDLTNMPNYLSLLRSYGFLPKAGIVVASEEESGTYYDNLLIDLIPYMQSTDITLDLISGHSDTLLLAGSRAFEQPTESDNNLDVSVVLSSGYKAYLRDLSEGDLSLVQQDTDEIGPFALALQARRVTGAGQISRAFMLGCSTLLTSSQIYAMTDTQEFIMKVVPWLAGSTPVNLSIMAKTALRPALSTASKTPGVLLITAVPLLVLLAALCVLLPRRNK